MFVNAIPAVNLINQAYKVEAVRANRQPQDYSLGLRTENQEGSFSLDRPNVQSPYLANRLDFLA